MRVDYDPTRHIANGHVIPTETYSDQPYLVRTDDGAWLCVMTTGTGSEGDHGQHIISLRSMDQGRTWSDPVDVESADDPESSYAVALKTPRGRIYCFYNFNVENRLGPCRQSAVRRWQVLPRGYAGQLCLQIQ